MKENISMERRMELESLNGQIIDGIKANGQVEHNMDMEYIIQKVNLNFNTSIFLITHILK